MTDIDSHKWNQSRRCTWRSYRCVYRLPIWLADDICRRSHPSISCVRGVAHPNTHDIGSGLSTATLRKRIAVVRQPGALPALLVTTIWE